MIENIASWIFSILIVLMSLYNIYLGILCVYSKSKFKCRKKHYNKYFKPCREDACKWSSYCDDYYKPPTNDEIKHLYKMIDELKEKQDNKKR